MKRTPVVLIFIAMLCGLPLHAQTPPILTALTANQPAHGTVRLPGLAVNLGFGMTLTSYGSNFSDNRRVSFRPLAGIFIAHQYLEE